MTQIEARERVERGAALLDRERPGWAQRIDCGALNIAYGCDCILGQLEGSYGAACARINGAQCDPWGHGFAADLNDWMAGCATLQDAWIEAICDRVVPKPLAQPESALTTA